MIVMFAYTKVSESKEYYCV